MNLSTFTPPIGAWLFPIIQNGTSFLLSLPTTDCRKFILPVTQPPTFTQCGGRVNIWINGITEFIRIGICQNPFFDTFLRNWKLSELEFVWIGFCQNRNLSELVIVRVGICQNPNLSESEFVTIGICQNPNLSELEFVRIGICQNLMKLGTLNLGARVFANFENRCAPVSCVRNCGWYENTWSLHKNRRFFILTQIVLYSSWLKDNFWSKLQRLQ